MTRKLATVETITAIRDIPDADAIVCATIRGWDVVVKRDEFAPGDACVYIEVDTLVDVTDERFEFLTSRGVRTDAEGVSGHVLKTAKLRGQYSQGLALPYNSFPEIEAFTAVMGFEIQPGDDVTDLLPVKRWDPPLPAQLSGQVEGVIPGWIRKTDEERLQNLDGILAHRGLTWVATEKLDGTSTTVYVDPVEGTSGVCSRNYDLTMNPEQTQWRLALEMRLHERMSEEWQGKRVVVQGETLGEGIQGNPLKVKGQRLALFTIAVDGRDLPRSEWPQWAMDYSVPLLELEFPDTLENAVDTVDGLASVYSPGRKAEGVVWRAADASTVTLSDGSTVRASFKVISRAYLLKNDR